MLGERSRALEERIAATIPDLAGPIQGSGLTFEQGGAESVRLLVEDPDEPRGVDAPDVTGVQPAVDERRRDALLRAVGASTPEWSDEQRATYSRVTVDLSEPRWVFLNTLFSLSSASTHSKPASPTSCTCIVGTDA